MGRPGRRRGWGVLGPILGTILSAGALLLILAVGGGHTTPLQFVAFGLPFVLLPLNATILAWMEYLGVVDRWIAGQPLDKRWAAGQRYKATSGLLLGLPAVWLAGVLVYPFTPLPSYNRILAMHSYAHVPQHRHTRPIIYMSYFVGGNPRVAEDFGAYPTQIDGRPGFLMAYEHINPEGRGGGGGFIDAQTSPQTFRTISGIPTGPAFPTGLRRPWFVAPSHLLAVSAMNHGVWRTEYYDWRHLPAPVQAIMNAIADKPPSGMPLYKPTWPPSDAG